MTFDRRKLTIACYGGIFLLVFLIFYMPSLRISSVASIDHSNDDFNTLSIFVIPGGGSGRNISGYPEWTSRRTIAAYEKYMKQSISRQDHIIFLALSAGSLNSPNRRLPDDRIIFECQKTIEHLKQLGIPKAKIFGDFLSWDTVTNGLALRLFLEGYLSSHSSYKKIDIEIFISDFHAQRVKLTFEWILQLSPSFLSNPPSSSSSSSQSPLADRQVNLLVHEISSIGIFDHQTLHERLAHEEIGLQLIKKNQQTIQTISSFYHFIFVNGHHGLSNYLQGEYSVDGRTKVGYR